MTAAPNTPPLLAGAALFYATKLSWPVFPLHGARNGVCTCGRPDCGNVGKHPRTKRGFLDATTDPAQIDRWWKAQPDSNIGVPTGAASGFVAVDEDPRNGGTEGLAALLEELGLELPPTPISLTGGDGRHILLKRPDVGDHASIRTTKLATGVDFKADGGYIVAPPSVHGSGRSYKWKEEAKAGEVALAEMPQALLARVVAPPHKASRPAKNGAPRAGSAAPSTPLRESFLYLAFEAAGWLAEAIDADRIAVVCPWASSHTTGGGGKDTSTILFAPDAGHTLGWFHCSHSHCAHRTERHVLDVLPASAVVEAKRRERRAAPPPATSIGTDGPGPDWDAAPASPPDRAWEADLSRDRFGGPKNTYGNLCLILRHTYGKRLAFDAMRGAPTVDERPLDDADIGRTREQIERAWSIQPTEGNVVSAVRQVAAERSFHPVQSYLRSLTWDGTPRLSRVAPDILGAPEQFATRLLTAWFVAACKRALEPGCKVDIALVLVGPQGLRKSTFFSILAGRFFADTNMDISSRDGLMQLAAAWIYEWPELENVTSRKQAAEVKGFITSPTDTFRQPFARAIVQHPRSSVIVGTTNEPQFLNDPTGDRRFWIVTVTRRINIEQLAAQRDQLWAEAMHLAGEGYQHYLDEAEELVRAEQAEKHHVSDVIQDAIAEWLDGQAARKLLLNQGWVTMAELLELAMKLPRDRWDRPAQMRVGAAMKRLKWKHVRRRVGERVPWVYIAPDAPDHPEPVGHTQDEPMATEGGPEWD
jgi:hypothetical protein